MKSLRALLLFGSFTILNSAPLQSDTLFFKSESSDRRTVTAGAFSFSIDNVANFTFSQGTTAWLKSAPAFLYTDGKRFSAEDGSLILDHDEEQAGADKMGSWKSQCFVYKAGTRLWRVCAKVWQNLAEPIVVFQQQFINGTEGSARHTDRVISSFPSFQLPTGDTGLSFFSYQGSMFGGTDIVIQRWNTSAFISGGTVGGPVAVFDQSNGVCIMAPFSEFMATSRELDENQRLNWGVMGGVQSVPKGYIQQTIVHCGTTGINRVFSAWGDFMRTYYNKEDDYRRSDMTLRYLGYWTDGGAYYYYNTEPNKTYEQTILDVKQYTDSTHIPFRYVQYDSWFYPKGPEGGVLTWNATKEIAPDGFQYLFNKNLWPVGAHNRWWSSKTPYAKANGGQYDFIVEKEKAIPQDLDFWLDLFKEARTWGLVMYEQDWLDQEFGTMNATQSTVDVAKTWLVQMGQAAHASGLTIQYCMSNPRHAMQSLEIPVVTQARVSGDYRAGSDQWKIGYISIFADAMGIAPFKDTFWTTEVQPGNPYKLEEPNGELQTAVSTLSTGPVGPSDMIQHINASILMQCCRADGLILKPSRPATVIDKQLWERAWHNGIGPGGEVWTTYSRIGQWYFGIILSTAMDTSPTFSLTPADAGFDFFSPTSVMSRATRGSTPVLNIFGASQPVSITKACTRRDICLYYTSPDFMIGPHSTKITIYGEEDKFVPMSSDRVSNLEVTTDNLILTLQGTSGESIMFSNFMDGQFFRHTCTFGETGMATLSLKDPNSTCQMV